MPKVIDRNTQNKVVAELALKNKSQKEIGKQYSIAISTIQKIYHRNKDLYNSIVDELKRRVENRALLTADKIIKNITPKKIKAEDSVLALSTAARNLTTISQGNVQNVANIIINIPQNKEELVKFVLDAEIIDNSITNESANNTEQNHSDVVVDNQPEKESLNPIDKSTNNAKDSKELST